MKHTYYQIILKLETPLSIGSGEKQQTDSDVIKDNNGTPYIPASSIAGVMRHYFKEEKKRNSIFGYINGSKSSPSSVIFYDALLSGNCVTSVRDSVKLKNKVAVDGAKFDFQIVETGAEFTTYIELDKNNYDKQSDIEELLGALSESVLRFGSKTSRGYGKTKIISLRKAEFDIETQKREWLDFDIFDAECWKNIPTFTAQTKQRKYDTVKLELKQKGALSIRVYTTEVSQGTSAPDYKQLTLRNGVPVIPGTSWAGCFRERFESLSDKEAANIFFGYVTEKTNETQKSQIVFDESQISGHISKNVTRTSVDRFSAEVKNGALYTECTCYNGTTELSVYYPADIEEKYRKILGAVILDLDNGYLSLGGLTSVGRGIFSVEKITVNGQDRTLFLKENNASELLAGE